MKKAMTAWLVLYEKAAKKRSNAGAFPLPLALGTGLALFLLLTISAGRPFLDVGWYLVLYHTLPRYDYSGYTSHLPSHLRPGETMDTAWLAYAHTQESVSGGPRPVILRTLLVSEQHSPQELCGIYQAPMVLESITTDDRSGFLSLFAPAKQIRIPPTVPAGNYYFVQEVRMPMRISCQSNPLHIDPPDPA